MKSRRMALRGSYTVEAAAVVSLTILVLASLILLSFYVHDQAVFQSYVCNIAASGSIQPTQEARELAVQKAEAEVKKTRFLGSTNLSGQANAGKKKVSAEWQASYPVPGFAARYLAGSRFSIQKSWTCEIADPTAKIRIFRAGASLIPGGES